MKLLVLNRVFNPIKLYCNPKNLVHFGLCDDGSFITLSDGSVFIVTEKPEEIVQKLNSLEIS